MTDKEIIIDGVDVSGCRYLPYCEDKQGNCGNNPNCYFKQLNRKDHELKTICKAFEIECLKNTKTGEVTYRSNNLLRKEQECEKYEQALNDIEKYQKRNCETCAFYKTDKCGISCQTFVITTIINKAKDGNE